MIMVEGMGFIKGFQKGSHVNGCLAEPYLEIELTSDKSNFSPLDTFDQMLHSQHVHGFVALLCAKNNILMDISQTRRFIKSIQQSKFRYLC